MPWWFDCDLPDTLERDLGPRQPSSLKHLDEGIRSVMPSDLLSTRVVGVNRAPLAPLNPPSLLRTPPVGTNPIKISTRKRSPEAQAKAQSTAVDPHRTDGLIE